MIGTLSVFSAQRYKITKLTIITPYYSLVPEVISPFTEKNANGTQYAVSSSALMSHDFFIKPSHFSLKISLSSSYQTFCAKSTI